MKLIVLTLISFFFSVSTQAAESREAIAKLKNEVRRSKEVAPKVYETMRKQTRLAKLEQFAINWSSLECIVSKNVEAGYQSEGTCVVTADAMHISAQMIIVKTEKGVVTFISDYVVE